MHFGDLLFLIKLLSSRIYMKRNHDKESFSFHFSLYRTHLFFTQAKTVHEVSHKQQQREPVSSKDQINVIRVYLMGN